MIKNRTKTIILPSAEKGTWRQPALVAGEIPVRISSMSCRRKDEGFSVSGTLRLLLGSGFMLPSEINNFSNTFCILPGEAEVLAVLFSSIPGTVVFFFLIF